MKARNKEIIYRRISTTKERIDIAPEDEKCIEVIKDMVIIVARGRKYDTVAMAFFPSRWK